MIQFHYNIDSIKSSYKETKCEKYSDIMYLISHLKIQFMHLFTTECLSFMCFVNILFHLSKSGLVQPLSYEETYVRRVNLKFSSGDTLFVLLVDV